MFSVCSVVRGAFGDFEANPQAQCAGNLVFLTGGKHFEANLRPFISDEHGLPQRPLARRSEIAFLSWQRSEEMNAQSSAAKLLHKLEGVGSPLFLRDDDEEIRRVRCCTIQRSIFALAGGVSSIRFPRTTSPIPKPNAGMGTLPSLITLSNWS